MSNTISEVLAALIVFAVSGFLIWRVARGSGKMEEALKVEKEKIDEFIERKRAEIEARDTADKAQEAGSTASGPAPTSKRLSDADFRKIFGRDRRPGE